MCEDFKTTREVFVLLNRPVYLYAARDLTLCNVYKFPSFKNLSSEEEITRRNVNGKCRKLKCIK